MPYCSNCGTKVNDNANFCPNCSAKIYTGQRDKKYGFQEAAENLNNTADMTDSFDPNDIAQNKIFALFAYLGILVLIPIFAASNSKFAKFHANQGLVLLIFAVGYYLICGILNSILLFIWWRLFIISSLLYLIGLIFIAPMIIGIVNVANGRAKELPIIGSIKILKY